MYIHTVVFLPYNDLVDRAHFHNVLKLFIHVSQSELTCDKHKQRDTQYYTIFFALENLIIPPSLHGHSAKGIIIHVDS